MNLIIMYNAACLAAYIFQNTAPVCENSRGVLNKHIWHRGMCLPQEPSPGGRQGQPLASWWGKEGRTQGTRLQPWRWQWRGGESDWENRARAWPSQSPLPAQCGQAGPQPWVCCLPALKGEAGTDVSLNQKITLAPRWAALWRQGPPPTILCQGLSCLESSKGWQVGLWHQRGTLVLHHHPLVCQPGCRKRAPPTHTQATRHPLAFPCPAAKSPMLQQQRADPRLRSNQPPSRCSTLPPEDREALPDAPLQPLP